MIVKRINVATDGSGDYTISYPLSGKRLYGWYLDINSLATSTTTDITFTDDTGRTLDSVTNVTANGVYISREADTDTATHIDKPPIAGSLTVTVAQGGATVTDGVIWVWIED